SPSASPVLEGALRKDNGKHSFGAGAPSGRLALGSPSTTSAKMRSPRPSALKVRTSSLTQRDAALAVEQITIRELDSSSALRMAALRFEVVGSSSRSRNIGVSRRGTV